MEIRREEEVEVPLEAVPLEAASEVVVSEALAADHLVVEVPAVPGRRNRKLCCSTLDASTLPHQKSLLFCLQEDVLQCLPC